MNNLSFSLFPNENFLDLRLYQYGWEQCAPLHSFGPFIRNHFLFHYVISGQGVLDSTPKNGVTNRYYLEENQGFLICPGQVNTYSASEKHPWKYVWLEFDGLRASEHLSSAGLDISQPLYRPKTPAMGEAVRDLMLYIADHSESSSLHLIGHLFLFLDALIESSATRREFGGAQLRDFYIQEAITFIEQNYQRDLTVEEIADVCKLNRSYFSKLFKENMEMFNLKCHDMKHQIREIGANKGIPHEALEEIESKITVYDSVVKTGNDVLDTILTEKNLKCNRDSITLT